MPRRRTGRPPGRPRLDRAAELAEIAYIVLRRSTSRTAALRRRRFPHSAIREVLSQRIDEKTDPIRFLHTYKSLGRAFRENRHNMMAEAALRAKQ